jgi:hypothetical protein
MKVIGESILTIDIKISGNHTFIANHLPLLPLVVLPQLVLPAVAVLLAYSISQL